MTLRAAGIEIDVIAVTAVRDAAVVRSAVSLGIVQYLIKPFGFATFAEYLWLEHVGTRTAHQSFVIDYSRAATSTFWQIKVADPQRDAGRVVLASTHSLQEARRCDQVLLLAGRTVALGPPA